MDGGYPAHGEEPSLSITHSTFYPGTEHGLLRYVGTTCQSYDMPPTPTSGKAILLQDWTGPEGSRRLRLTNFMTVGT